MTAGSVRRSRPSQRRAGPERGRPRPTERPRPELPVLVVGKTPGVTADDTLAEAGRKVLRFHLARMIAREAGTRAGEDPEELHSMRVATRRMRAAWRVFGDAYPPGRTSATVVSCAMSRAQLGAVRDLDVLLEGSRRTPPLCPADRNGLEPLLDDWRSRRDAASACSGAELDSTAYAQFVDEYRAFVGTDGLAVLHVSPTRRTASATRSVADLAGLRAGPSPTNRSFAGPTSPTLHELRIAGEVAALHARVRPGAARTRGPAAHRAGRRHAGPPGPA